MPTRRTGALFRPERKVRMKSVQSMCLAAAVVVVPLLASCGTAAFPTPRSVIVFSGARIQADTERMREVDERLREQLEHIDRSRGFAIRVNRSDSRGYPWDRMEIEGDTARIFVYHLAPDTETPAKVYAHFHLMARRGALERWLPEASEAEGFELERAVLKRIADVWLLGRSVFDVQAHEPLDELLYASEHGFLDEFIFATQGDRFEAERTAHYEAAPERREEFREWFLDTFDREGPGYVRPAEEEGGEDPG